MKLGESQKTALLVTTLVGILPASNVPVVILPASKGGISVAVRFRGVILVTRPLVSVTIVKAGAASPNVPAVPVFAKQPLGRLKVLKTVESIELSGIFVGIKSRGIVPCCCI